MADVDTNIYRPTTSSDKQYFDVDLNKKKRKTPQQRFEEELGKQELEATKKGLPFAKRVARDDFNQAVKSQIDAQLREYGSIEYPEKIKVPEIDWSKYSDLKNFEVIEEGETSDDHLTRRNPGLNVTVKKKTYKFKGYGQTYTVMESANDAIQRAQEKTWKAQSKVQK